MSHLQLSRPLVVFDLETTGIDPGSDKIVEISALRLDPDGGQDSRTRRLNPGRPIPAEATTVHGIGDEDVRDAPSFRQIARSLLEFLADADLAGFNVQRFDAPLLDREFMDCGLEFGLCSRRVIDVMTIFRRMERRDLAAAVRFYLGREHQGAHTAASDVAATAEILQAQLERYPALPRTVDELDGWARRRPDAVDSSGRLVWRDGDVTLAFGRYAGRRLTELARDEPDYVDWLLASDLPADTRQILRRARGGQPGR